MAQESKGQIKEHSYRRMTVQRGIGQLYNDKHVSCIRLMGKWLYDAGFCPGDKFVIVVHEGKLEIHSDRNA